MLAPYLSNLYDAIATLASMALRATLPSTRARIGAISWPKGQQAGIRKQIQLYDGLRAVSYWFLYYSGTGS